MHNMGAIWDLKTKKKDPNIYVWKKDEKIHISYKMERKEDISIIE